jgi:GNAT superfamily N-acetyltransferase
MTIRPLEERDLAEAERIYRQAFGTFLNLPDPMTFGADRDVIRTRWVAKPTHVLAADVDGRLAGSNFLTRWGTVGFFGPLTVQPDHWGTGVAKRLLQATTDIFDEWQLTHAGLYTFAGSAKHARLYQKFDFWPRFLTMNMARPVREKPPVVEYVRFSHLSASDKLRSLADCRSLTDAIYDGLDASNEIESVDIQRLGDTLLVYAPSQLVGLAAAHCGAGTEAGPGVCYVKFGAILPGHRAEEHFCKLLDSCEAYAASQGASRVTGGVNVARCEAYRCMLDQGFQIEGPGLAMQWKNEAGYNHSGVYLIDDWS